MISISTARAASVLGLLIIVLTSVAGSANVITGSVIDAEDRSPLPGTQVEILDEEGLPVGVTVTDQHGRFQVSGLDTLRYSILFVRPGFAAVRLDDVLAGGPQAADLKMILHALPFRTEVMVVTASRKSEHDLRAPASTSVIGRREIDARPQFTPVDLTCYVTGIDFASKGLVQHTFAARGVRGAISSGMLVLTDHRYAGLPVLDFNLPYLIPVTEDDIDRIEIVRGPGAALYGPNSDQGVMHIITRSPFDTPGTTVSLTGGERSIVQGTIRHAEKVSPDVAFKVSGQYFHGDDWQYHDPEELRNRQLAIEGGANAGSLRIARRDFEIERAVGEARLDWRLGPESTLVLTGGVAQSTNIDQANTVGAVQARDWRNSFMQARYEHARVRVNIVNNITNSGDTYALRSGLPIVDRSRVLAFQLQHGTTAAGRHDLLYGIDARRSDPRTGGTLHGSNEDRDITSEFGGYLNLTSTLSTRWDLVGALRVDYHDRINDLALSPRLGAVYQPTPDHAIRLTWNRAFSSPTANDLFIDYPTGVINGMATRLRGIPKDGYRFDRHDGDYLMRTPLHDGDVAEPLPADATLTWNEFLPVLLAALEDDAPGIAAQIAGLTAPDALRVESDLGLLDPRTGTFLPLGGADIADVSADERVITNTIELGYKGNLGRSVSLAMDAYRTNVTDFFGELYAVTPSVLFDEATLQEYFETDGGLSAVDAATAATVAAGIPVGTIAPEGFESADVLLANRQGGQYTIWGSDLAVSWRLSRAITLAGAYSWISDNMFLDQSHVGPMGLSVPRNKGALGIRLRDDRRGLESSAQMRAVESFPVISGVFVGNVQSYVVVDLGLGYRISSEPDTHWSLNVANLFDDRHREFVGAPELGRLVTSRIRVRF